MRVWLLVSVLPLVIYVLFSGGGVANSLLCMAKLGPDLPLAAGSRGGENKRPEARKDLLAQPVA